MRYVAKNSSYLEEFDTIYVIKDNAVEPLRANEALEDSSQTAPAPGPSEGGSESDPDDDNIEWGDI